MDTVGAWYLNDTPPTSPVKLRVLAGSRAHGRVVDGQGRGVNATLRAGSVPPSLRRGPTGPRAR